VFSVLKNHIEVLKLMLDRCRHCHISMNLKKCIFCALFDILLGHVVFQQVLLVDTAKIVMIIELEPPTLVKQLRGNMGHIGYYMKFIKGCAQITTPIEGSKVPLERGLSKGFGKFKTKTSDHADFDLSRLEQGVPCSCRCIIHRVGCSTISTKKGRHRSPNCVCK
jgi:hypothetical protein